MRNSMIWKSIGILVAGGLVLAGCAAPERNAMLEEARAAYAAASSEPLVVSNAPVELRQAGESLQEAQELWEENAEMEQVSHQAYLARQQTATAREAAQLKLAQESIGQAETMRQQVLLEARSREAEMARQRADAGQRELEAAQLQAQERARQEQLARQQALRVQQEAELARQEAERARQEAAAEMQRMERELADLQARQTPRGIILTLQDIVFEVDKADIKPGAERSIEKIADFLKQHPERSILVEGFTDSTGPEEYNQKLSDDRARAVAEALVAKGIEPERIQTRGYGEDYPVASNQSAAGRQLNRRVEIVISGGTESVSQVQ